MIDWKRVTQLQDEIGETDFGEIVTLFLEEVDEVVARLGQGFEPAALAADLHFLKGSALNLGFRRFAAACQKGESAERSADTDPALVAQVIATYETSRAAFLERVAPPRAQHVG